jgi:VWFA-related protein
MIRRESKKGNAVMKIIETIPGSFRGFALLLATAFILGTGFEGQTSGAKDTSPQTPKAAQPESRGIVFTATTRVVALDVVAKDSHGQIVSDLKPEELRVFERVAKKGQREQKISNFNFINRASIAAEKQQATFKVPAGVYTNLVSAKLTVPPTILLVDGLNTDIDSGMRVRRQMVKMLATIPNDTPVAVFLLGHQLVMLQSFTTDPKLLSDAARKALAIDNEGLGTVDSRDDPSSLSAQTQEMFGGGDAPPPSTVNSSPGRGSSPSGPSGPPGGDLQMAAIRRFEKETFAADNNERVRITLDALRTIARHVSGYPGRKNLLWMSSSFPLTIAPDATEAYNLGFEGTSSFEGLVATATSALADAKVAVYPINPAGVQTQAMFEASVAPPAPGYGARPYSQGRTLNRENEARFSSQESMTEVAQSTGGKICINNNDLTSCVKTAVEEGSSYYEIAYYPEASEWHGEFHQVLVKTSRPGVQLSYREGYFAHNNEPVKQEKDKAGNDPQLQQAACQDLLTSTALLVVARPMPADAPTQAKYFLAIDSRMLTFAQVDEGNRRLHFDVAVCSFDRSGKPLQYLQDTTDQKMSEKEYASTSRHVIPHLIQFKPNEGTARVRLVVRDTATGQLGSIDVPYSVAAATPTPAATNNAAPSGPTPN